MPTSCSTPTTTPWYGARHELKRGGARFVPSFTLVRTHAAQAVENELTASKYSALCRRQRSDPRLRVGRALKWSVGSLLLSLYFIVIGTLSCLDLEMS